MKKEIAARWAFALRSGKYKQGRRSLCQNNKYCCLGVLCDLALQKGICVATYSEDFLLFDKSKEFLPLKVMEWSGMATSTGSRDGEVSLIELNDIGKYSFKKIANIIEKEYKNL